MTIDLARLQACAQRLPVAHAVLDCAGPACAWAGRVLWTARGVPGERTGSVLSLGGPPPRRTNGERRKRVAVRKSGLVGPWS